MLASKLPPPPECSGEGVVIVGGGPYWPGIVVAIKMLRRWHDWPIEVWHEPPREPVNLADIRGIPNVRVRSLVGLPCSPRLAGWPNKTTALVNCPFEKVLYLDADAYPVRDVGWMMTALDKAPFVYWSDLPNHWQSINWHWYGIDPAKHRKAPPVQGGQVAIHRGRWWRELVAAHWCNQHHEYFYHWDAQCIWNRHGYGDQDVFRAILTVTQSPFAHQGQARFVAPALVCDASRDVCIVHRVQAKCLWKGTDLRTEHLPGDKEVNAILDEYLNRRKEPEAVFGEIYDTGVWGAVGCSGPGSDETHAKPYLETVNRLIAANGWKTVVDLGCGDGRICLGLQAGKVIGVDCVLDRIEALRSAWPDRFWEWWNAVKHREWLPDGEVLLVKDVLQHWPNAVVDSWLEWAVASRKWKAIVMTHDWMQVSDGADCPLGGYRGLDPAMGPLKRFNPVVVGQILGKAISVVSCAPVTLG